MISKILDAIAIVTIFALAVLGLSFFGYVMYKFILQPASQIILGGFVILVFLAWAGERVDEVVTRVKK